MAFIQFSKVSLAFGDKLILDNVNVNLAAGSKAALAGDNGAGKSTLMKIMAGLLTADSGEVAKQKGAIVSYLPQSGITYQKDTLLNETLKAFDAGQEIFDRLQQINTELSALTVGSPLLDFLLKEHSLLQEKLQAMDFENRLQKTKTVLCGLGFLEKDFSKACCDFSSGWQMRVALAKVLLQTPDILLLDEPTNYLDLEARGWLCDFLKKFSGAFLLVSHDRYFLDTCVTCVYELFLGKLKCYTGNYSKYEAQRKQELETLQKAYQKQQLEIQHLKDFVNRFQYKATKAKQAQSRLKQLQKIVPIQLPEGLKKIHFSWHTASPSGKIVLEAKDLCFFYQKQAQTNTQPQPQSKEPPFVIKDLNLLLERGERLVVTGHNGAGKTTLLKIIARGLSPSSGSLRFGAGVKIGYFTADNIHSIAGQISVLEYMQSFCPLDLIPKLRDMLGAFLFSGDTVQKPLDVLSGGEKSRLAILQILLHPVNLLILDEPTNHLDLHSKDVLLDAIKTFGGTVIFVSHDRGFIQDLATCVLELKDGKHKYIKGTYDYYLEQTTKQQVFDKTIQPKDKQQTTKEKNKAPPTPTQQAQGNLLWQQQKEIAARKKKQQKQENQIISQIETLENKKSQLQNLLLTPSVYSDYQKAGDIQKQIKENEQNIKTLELQWQALQN